MVRQGQGVEVRVHGFAPRSSVRAWLLPDRVALGSFETDDDGMLDTVTERLGAMVAPCLHTVHVEGTLPDGERLRVSVGVWVDADPYPFADVAEGQAHRRAIACLHGVGVTHGVTAESYDPAGVLTRGQTASLLARWWGMQTDQDSGFADVAGTTHASTIAALAQAGVVRGFADGTFRPGSSVTRGQFASMLVAGLDLEVVEQVDAAEQVETAGRFADAGGAHDEAIAVLAQNRLIAGFADGTFRPGDPISRAQTATILVREMQRSR